MSNSHRSVPVQSSKSPRTESARLQAHISPESIYCPPKRLSSTPAGDYHIFFITGNPGLIAYYHTFLASLATLLDEHHEVSQGFHVYGHSLGGFNSSTDKKTNNAPYGLQQQIEFVESTLEKYVRAQSGVHRSQQAIDTSSHSPLKVILVGHSVGGYILLEVLRRHRKKVSLGEAMDMQIVGGVLLFPSVTHIAESPSGLKLGVRLATGLPFPTFKLTSPLVGAQSPFFCARHWRPGASVDLSYPRECALRSGQACDGLPGRCGGHYSGLPSKPDGCASGTVSRPRRLCVGGDSPGVDSVFTRQAHGSR